MRIETLLLMCCAYVIEGNTNNVQNNGENEVLDKGGVMVRFPSYLFEVPKETLKKNVVQRRIRGRTIPANVEPMEGKYLDFLCYTERLSASVDFLTNIIC